MNPQRKIEEQVSCIGCLYSTIFPKHNLAYE